ncbi:glutamine amidotransferase, partial [Pseudonocardia acidicola]
MPDTLSTPPLRVLVAGESWIKHTIHMKGFDQFHSTEYEEGAGVFLD